MKLHRRLRCRRARTLPKLCVAEAVGPRRSRTEPLGVVGGACRGRSRWTIAGRVRLHRARCGSKMPAGVHVYWHNPGEAGMPTTRRHRVLPEGWSPPKCGCTMLRDGATPIRFKTGGIVGFGFEEETLTLDGNVRRFRRRGPWPSAFRSGGRRPSSATWRATRTAASPAPPRCESRCGWWSPRDPTVRHELPAVKADLVWASQRPSFVWPRRDAVPGPPRCKWLLDARRRSRSEATAP